MRLTCPNCDAQYEVPDEVIPQAGRDVQCSNCGNTWYQYHPDNPPEEDREADPTAPDSDEETATPPPPPKPEPSAPEAPSRRELDPAVADILKQEAEAEEAARAAVRASQENLETQPDLGLDEAEPASDDARRAKEAATRMARIRGEDLPDDGPTTESTMSAAAMGSRKDLLPDVDEINSTLRSSSDGSSASGEMEVEAPTHKRKKRGFRFGFTLMLLLFVLAVLLYIFAPAIINAVPALEGVMTSYVAAADSFRSWIDGLVQTGLSWLDSSTATDGAN